MLCNTIQVCSYGTALGQENTSGITTSIQHARNLGRTELEPCRSSVLSPVLMQHPSKAVKATAWKTWKSYPTATEGFAITSLNALVPLKVTSAAFNMIERFTCTMYDTMTSHVKVNDLRLEMFPTRVKTTEQLPPTQSALLQHVNRCLYQVNILRESLKPIITAPSPEGFGCPRADTGWRPIWTPLPAATVSSVVARRHPLVRRNAIAGILGLHAQHSVSAADTVRRKNRLKCYENRRY